MIRISVFQYLNNLFEQGTFTTASNARNNLIGLSINGTMRAKCAFLSIVIEKLIKNTQFFDYNLNIIIFIFSILKLLDNLRIGISTHIINVLIGVNLNPHLI